MVDRSVPAGTPRGTVVGRFWRPLQTAVLAPYPDRYLAVLDAFGSAGMLGQLGLVRGMFPYAVLDEAFLARAAEAADAPGRARRAHRAAARHGRRRPHAARPHRVMR